MNLHVIGHAPPTLMPGSCMLLDMPLKSWCLVPACYWICPCNPDAWFLYIRHAPAILMPGSCMLSDMPLQSWCLFLHDERVAVSVSVCVCVCLLEQCASVVVVQAGEGVLAPCHLLSSMHRCSTHHQSATSQVHHPKATSHLLPLVGISLTQFQLLLF